MGSSAEKHSLTAWERIDAYLGAFSLVGTIVHAAISGPFRGSSGADSFHHHMIQALVKTLTLRFSPLQIQYLFPSYDEIYVKFCQKRGVKPHFVSNDRGLKGFWIGDPSAKYVVINFHGGGFAMDATEPYLDFWPGIQDALHEANVDTAWFYCTYTLTPHAVYPIQFREAVEALRYVLEDVGRSPSEILLAGDSAGGSLCLAILSHLTNPSKDVPELTIKEPLKAVVLMSPWVSFSHEWPSVQLNEHKDIDATEVTTRWSLAYLNGGNTDNYIEAVHAPSEWWKDAKVQQTLVLAGGDEVLLDPIKAWMGAFKESNPDTTLVVGEKECHVAPLIWPMFGDHHETQQESALKHWLCERLL